MNISGLNDLQQIFNARPLTYIDIHHFF